MRAGRCLTPASDWDELAQKWGQCPTSRRPCARDVRSRSIMQMRIARPQILLSLGLVSSLLALSGCAEAKFCDNMRKHYGEDQDDCEEDALPEVKAQCENANEVFACVAKAGDKEAADKCGEVCKRKEK